MRINNNNKHHREIYYFLYEQKIDKKLAKKIDRQNIPSVIAFHNKSWSEEEFSYVIDHISIYGMNIISIPQSQLFHNNFIVGNTEPRIKRKSYNHFRKESDSYFGKNQIGSLQSLFQECNPKNLEEWNSIIEDYVSDRIEKELDRFVGNQQEVFKDAFQCPLTKKQIDGYRESAKQFQLNLIKEMSFSGFSYQNAILKLIAKKLNRKLYLSDDKMDSVGVDGIIGDVEVNVKSSTYMAQSCFGYYDVPIIYYEIEKNNNVLINYDELVVKMFNN